MLNSQDCTVDVAIADDKSAREFINKINANGDPEMRERARGLLAQLVSVEEQMARIHKAEAERAPYLRRATSGTADEGGVQTPVVDDNCPVTAATIVDADQKVSRTQRHDHKPDHGTRLIANSSNCLSLTSPGHIEAANRR